MLPPLHSKKSLTDRIGKKHVLLVFTIFLSLLKFFNTINDLKPILISFIEVVVSADDHPKIITVSPHLVQLLPRSASDDTHQPNRRFEKCVL